MDSGFFASYLERLENLRQDISMSTAGLPQEAMDWEPGEEMNSIGVLLAHTTGSLRFWIGDVALGEPSGRVRESEFQTRGVPAEEMQKRLDEVIAYARHGLPGLSLADLDKEITVRDRTVSCGWALLHALEHSYMHLGHIQLTSQLWKERSKK